MNAETYEIITKQIQDNDPREAKELLEHLIRLSHSYDESLEIIGGLYTQSKGRKKKYKELLSSSMYTDSEILLYQFLCLFEKYNFMDDCDLIVRTYKNITPEIISRLTDISPEDYFLDEESLTEDAGSVLLSLLNCLLTEGKYTEAYVLIKFALEKMNFDEMDKADGLYPRLLQRRITAECCLEYDDAIDTELKNAEQAIKDEPNSAWAWISKIEIEKYNDIERKELKKIADKAYDLLIHDEFDYGEFPLLDYLHSFYLEYPNKKKVETLEQLMTQMLEEMGEEFNEGFAMDYKPDEETSEYARATLRNIAKAADSYDFSGLKEDDFMLVDMFLSNGKEVVSGASMALPIAEMKKSVQKRGFSKQEVSHIFELVAVLGLLRAAYDGMEPDASANILDARFSEIPNLTDEKLRNLVDFYDFVRHSDKKKMMN